MQRYLIATCLLVFTSSPALATEYYVAQDPATKLCKIVETKPDGKTMVMVGTSYPTRAEAFMAAAKDKDNCKN
jgi:hypothetical protein